MNPSQRGTGAGAAEAAPRYEAAEYARALLNILEDADEERARLRDTQKAVVNILDDAWLERGRLERTQRAVLNIMEDSADEKNRLREMQTAVLNVLDDLAGEVSERKRVEERARVLLETAPDAIAIFDESRRIVLVNAQTEVLFGYARSELLGQPIELLVPQPVEEDHPAAGDEQRVGVRKNGSEFPADILLSPVQTDEGLLHSAAIRDVTRAKAIERQIRASLGEKEALLQEIHHRVKNNLQIVASLLSLQSGYIDDPTMLSHFQESQGRIRSMALIHEKLYQSETLARVDLADYVRGLVTIVMRSYAKNGAVKLELQLDAASVSIDSAVPVGLMLNELVTNALKYAFPDGRPGRLSVGLRTLAGGEIELCVQDDGVGLPAAMKLEQATSLGLRLVRMFAKQLRAEVTSASVPGDTRFTIRFAEAERAH